MLHLAFPSFYCENDLKDAYDVDTPVHKLAHTGPEQSPVTAHAPVSVNGHGQKRKRKNTGHELVSRKETGTMAIDWIGFAYASLLAVGGVVAYTRKGSKISLAAGLTFGSVAAYGAYCVTCDPRNVKMSLSCKIQDFSCGTIGKCSAAIVQYEIPTSDEFIAASISSCIFSFDHYNGNEVQEVQEINASWTSGMPEPFDDFEACFYAAVGELSNLRVKHDCHAH
ncbi:transmembrane protein 14A [Willisornis vidua]|uniref:Transmembrane protein 14A n=1 Tax=Willisornis vidua TaxID=1566151 RepID=A0ABQ9DRM5_9PASS|nr:transmembrane protein 14A [Willisornis vidua]